MPVITESTDSKERLDDVMLAVSAYADMVAIIFQMTQGHPMVPVLTSHWMSVLLFKLKEWGALTDLQHDQLMHRIQADVAARSAKSESLPSEGEVTLDDDVQSLLRQLGI